MKASNKEIKMTSLSSSNNDLLRFDGKVVIVTGAGGGMPFFFDFKETHLGF